MILAAQLAREAVDDFVSHAEKVGEGSVKAVGPQTRAASTSCALFTRPSGIVETDSVTACASSSLFVATFGLLFLVVLRGFEPRTSASAGIARWWRSRFRFYRA
jgi:hypothetical protein